METLGASFERMGFEGVADLEDELWMYWISCWFVVRSDAEADPLEVVVPQVDGKVGGAAPLRVLPPPSVRAVVGGGGGRIGAGLAVSAVIESSSSSISSSCSSSAAPDS